MKLGTNIWPDSKTDYYILVRMLTVFELILIGLYVWKAFLDKWPGTLAIFVGCGLLLAPLPINQNTIWWIFDRLIRFGKQMCRWTLNCDSLNLTKWDQSFENRRALLKMGTFGILLVVAFAFARDPFDWCPPFNQWLNKLPKFERWEWPVCAWSATFLVVFFIREANRYATVAKSKVQNVMALAYISAFICFVTVLGLATLMLTPGLPALIRLLAEFAFCAIICIQDVIFANRYNALRMKDDASNFIESLVLIDLPGLAAFGALLLYGWMWFGNESFPSDLTHFWAMIVNGWTGAAPVIEAHINEAQENEHAFTSGAAALNLILINTAFISLSIWQVYEDAQSTEAKPDEAKPDEAKPNEAKPNEAKPNEAKPNEAKTGQGRPGDPKSGGARAQLQHNHQSRKSRRNRR